MAKARILNINQSTISVIHQNEADYISLTDMTASFQEGSGLIGKWITNKNTLEYLGVWEKIKNPYFNYPEFGVIGQEAGTNRFIMSAGQWIDRTKAIGLLVKAGRYGGTFAHKDIALEFASWISIEFKLYIIKEFQRLKDDENNRLQLDCLPAVRQGTCSVPFQRSITTYTPMLLKKTWCPRPLPASKPVMCMPTKPIC